jgi:phosphonate transport system substrate-binding protein
VKRILASLAVIFSCMAATNAVAAKRAVSLGVIDGSANGGAVSEMRAMMAHLATSPAYDVTLKVFPNHDSLYAALKDGKIDLALLGPVKYVEAHDEIGAIPIVAEGEKVRSYIVVPAKSPIRTAEELKGKTFAFGYPDSTTTHLIPLLLLSKHGVKKDDIKATFVGHQQQLLVDETLAGKYAACPVSQYILDKNKQKLRVIETSDAFSGPPVVVRKELDTKVVSDLRTLFLSYKPSGDGLTQRFGTGATPVTDADYNRIRFLCKVLFNKTYH